MRSRLGSSFENLTRDILPPWPSLWRCALTGAFGIASGFAVFMLWLDEITGNWMRFVVALLVAAGVSLVFESFREEVEGHQAWRPPRMLGMIVLLTIAEVFVMGYHATVSKAPQLGETLEVLLGEEVRGSRAQALAVVGLWLLLGAVTAIGLGGMIFNTTSEIPADAPPSRRVLPACRVTLRCGGLGGLTGAAAGAGSMLIYVFVDRFSVHHQEWEGHLNGALQATSSWWPVWLMVKGVQLLDNALSYFGPLDAPLTLVILVGALVLIARSRQDNKALWLLAGLAAISIVYLYPLADRATETLKLAGLMAYVWAVPGVILGMITPWLKVPSGYPRLWGLVAFGAALVLVISALATPWLVVPAVVFAALSLWFLWYCHGLQVEQYWSVLALGVAVIVYGTNHVVVHADFFRIEQMSFELASARLNVIAYHPPPPLFEPLPRYSWVPGESLSRLGQAPRFDADLLQRLLRAAPTRPLELRRSAPWNWPGRSDRGGFVVSPDALIDADILKTELQRQDLVKARADFEKRRDALKAVQGEVATRRRTVPQLDSGEYSERYRRMKELDKWRAEQVAARDRVLQDATATLTREQASAASGQSASYSGQDTTDTQAKLDALRTEQQQLAAARQELIGTLHQVKEVADALAPSLTEAQCASPRTLPSSLSALGCDVKAVDAKLRSLKVRAFELALTASGGFWITLGLLASWSIRRRQDESDAREK